MASTNPDLEPWYLDHQLVVALRVDEQRTVVDATTGLSQLLGVPLASLTGQDLAEFANTYLAGSASAQQMVELDPQSAHGVDAQLIDANGSLRRVHLHASASSDDARTIVVTDTTELASTQDHLVRRMAHDRLLHVVVSDLLDASLRQADRVVADVLSGLAEYFGLVTAALTSTTTGAPTIIAFASKDGCDRDSFERLSAELPLLESPDVNELVDAPGPGDVWHITLDADDRFALGLAHHAVTAIQITVPDGDAELSFLATLAGRQFPPKADLELLHNALSHMAQFVRRAAAEEEIRRHSVVDEALATAATRLLDAERPTLLAALSDPAARIGAVMGCTSVDIRSAALVDPNLRSEFDDWHEPRPVSPESLGFDPLTRGTWAAPISDGRQVIGLLSYIVTNPKAASDAAQAWLRLLGLVPATSARLDTERRLEAAFQNAPVGIVLRDPDGCLVDCNDSFLRFLNVTSVADIHGCSQRDLVETDMCDDAMLRLLDSGTSPGIELPFRQHNGGDIVWGRLNTTRVDRDSAAMSLDHIEDVTAARAAKAELDTQRNRDALTGLPNRALIEHELAARLNNNEPVTVTVIDIDRFHSVNSSLGHIAGDRLLQLVAKRLLLTIGPRAELARTGGDEFMVIAPIASHQLGSDVAERILTALRQPFDVDGHEVLTGASLGVCISRGNSSPDELLLGASAALAKAKRAGRNRVVHHTSKGDPRRVGLFESALRRAVHEKALTVHYQPEFDLDTSLIIGAEALVRWPHPTDGLLGAGLFVPLAEEIGLFSDLSDFVLNQACLAATQWRKDLSPSHFKIRVNLSPRDIEQPNIVDRVMKALESSGLPVDSLCLEVTETAFMRDQRTVIRHLHELADRGISLAIDDFGTGFSSLWLLRELPFDTLKIDQSFVAALDGGAPEDRAIVETIVNLGRILGMEITAEGVETPEQFRILREIGVKRGQGYLFARPESEQQIEETIVKANLERATRARSRR